MFSLGSCLYTYKTVNKAGAQGMKFQEMIKPFSIIFTAKFRDMSIEELRALCLSFPGTTEDIKWEKDLCFSVGGKMFLVTSTEALPISASFKSTPEGFEELTKMPGYKPAPYLARYKWVYVEDIRLISRTDWEEYVQLSYSLVLSKLPAKLRKALEGEIRK